MNMGQEKKRKELLDFKTYQKKQDLLEALMFSK